MRGVPTCFTAGNEMPTHDSAQVQYCFQAGLPLQEQPHFGVRVSTPRAPGLLFDCVPSLPPSYPVCGGFGTAGYSPANSMEDCE